MYAVEKMREYVRICIELELCGFEILLKYTEEELCRICNGIGSSDMPQILNRAISRFNPSLVAASIIHDVQWMESSGRRSDFFETNAHFEINGRLVAAHRYPGVLGFIPRYYVRRKSRLFRAILDEVGFAHYKKCHNLRNLNHVAI